jgi:type II secretory pathway pseudopilin PulG
MIADAVAGIALLAVLATSIVIAVRSQQRGAERLSDSRGATWVAERALAEMQAGRAVSMAASDVRVEPLDAESVPQGFAWVRVRGERNGRSAEVIGLVPKATVPAAQGGQR